MYTPISLFKQAAMVSETSNVLNRQDSQADVLPHQLSFFFFSFFFLFQNLRVELRQQTWNWRSGIVINEQTSKIGPQLATKSNVQIDSR
jgi:hypothetical protein